MCSVSWFIDSTGYQLFFNRDEQKTRAKALPPRVQHMDGMKILMPIDPVGQGSWISTNEMGMSLCLLNNYQADHPNTAVFSRGLLLKNLSKEDSVEKVLSAFSRLSLSQFAPFILLAFDLNACSQDGNVMSLEWDGINSTIRHIETPLFSSSVDFLSVTTYRKTVYEQMVGQYPSEEKLLSFHQHHHENHHHMSVCMHRDDAETVSFTQIKVTAQEQSMRYISGSPNAQLTEEVLQQNSIILPRRRALNLSY